jgi:hypothetical protein
MYTYNCINKLDIVKTLNYSADLVEIFGNVKLKSGLTLKNSLVIDGISFWDIFTPELAHSHISKIFASKSSPDLIQKIKPEILHLRDFFSNRKLLKYKSKVFVSDMIYDKKILYLGFTNQMYRDVIQPIAQRIDMDTHDHGLILTDKNPTLTDYIFSDRCSFGSIWNYYDNFTLSEASKIKRSILLVAKELGDYKILTNSLPGDVEYLSGHFELLFNSLFKYYLPKAALQVVLARKVFSFYGPDIVVSPDVSDSRTRIYTILARHLNIPSLDLQFGLAGNEAIEWRFLFADKVAVWGSDSKKYLMKQGVTKDRILITGSPRHDHIFTISKKELAQKKNILGIPDKYKVFVLASTYSLKTHDKYSDPKLLINMKKAVFDAFQNLPNAFLIVKPHPVENEFENRTFIGNSANIIQIDRDSDIRELIKICDCFISFGSTATIDALIADKLVICPILDGWVFSDTFKDSGAVIIPTTADQIKTVVKDISIGFTKKYTPNRETKKNFLKKKVFLADGKSTYRIKSLILETISQGSQESKKYE